MDPECELVRLRESLHWSICRLYDAELITSSRACELLGCKMQDFRSVYADFMMNKCE